MQNETYIQNTQNAAGQFLIYENVKPGTYRATQLDVELSCVAFRSKTIQLLALASSDYRTTSQTKIYETQKTDQKPLCVPKKSQKQSEFRE